MAMPSDGKTVEFIVNRGAAAEPFRYGILIDDPASCDNLPIEAHPAPNIEKCSCCTAVDPGCSACSALLPVLGFFAGVTSTEEVGVAVESGEYRYETRLSAQQAAFQICIHALIFSPCRLFNRYRWSFDQPFQIHDADTFFKKLILSVAFAHICNSASSITLSEIRDQVRLHNKLLKDRLHDVFGFMRLHAHSDSILNAFTIIFSLHTLTGEYFDDLLGDFLCRRGPE